MISRCTNGYIFTLSSEGHPQMSHARKVMHLMDFNSKNSDDEMEHIKHVYDAHKEVL